MSVTGVTQTLDSPVLAWNQFLDVAEMSRPVFSAADPCGLFRFPMVPAKVLTALGRRGNGCYRRSVWEQVSAGTSGLIQTEERSWTLIKRVSSVPLRQNNLHYITALIMRARRLSDDADCFHICLLSQCWWEDDDCPFECSKCWGKCWRKARDCAFVKLYHSSNNNTLNNDIL